MFIFIDILWKRWKQAVIVAVLAVRTMVIRNTITKVGIIDHETEGIVLARIGIALLELQLAAIAGKSYKILQYIKNQVYIE